MLGEVEDDVKVARYEPMSIRPTDKWLERRRQISVEIGALLGVAWLAMDDDRALAPTTGARLNSLADRLSPADLLQFPPSRRLSLSPRR